MKWALPAADTYFAPMLAQDPRGFQIDHLELALKHCKRFRTAVDGGAHVGTWTVTMAGRFDRVIAFEPAPDTFACLSENVRGFINVETHRVALGASETTGEIVDDRSRTGNTGSRHLGEAESGSVLIRRLDCYDVQDVDFLKLDVEGHEQLALIGAEATLKRCRPVVLIECKRFTPPRFGCSPQGAVAYLHDLGYRPAGGIRNDRVFVFKD